jgi:hypothetical protein
MLEAYFGGLPKTALDVDDDADPHDEQQSNCAPRELSENWV